MYDMDKEYLILDISKLTKGTLTMLAQDCGIDFNYPTKEVKMNEYVFDVLDEELFDIECDKIVDELYLDKDQFVEDYMKAKQNELKNSK